MTNRLVSGTPFLVDDSTGDIVGLRLADGSEKLFVFTTGSQTLTGTKTFADVVVTNLDAGASGPAGPVDIFPTTAAKGKATFSVASQTNDTTVTHRTAAMGQATTITTPDPGAAAASVVLTEGAQTINGAKTFGGAVIRAGRQIIIPVCGNAKVGATAGWVITGGTNKNSATLPASQTASTLVIPISGLEVGDTVTAVDVVGQVESAGGNVTLSMDVRKLTAAAEDLTDASLATDNVGTLVADTVLSSANLGVTGLTEVLAATEALYVLLTGTTAASTDIDVMSLVVTVTRS
jgi:hypothetical protein